MAEHVAGTFGQLLGQGDHRLVREAGQHRVLELVELILQRRIDARIGVAEQVDPPRADRIQITLAVGVVQPDAATVADGDQRHRFMVLHLRAWMPDAAQTARYPVGLLA